MPRRKAQWKAAEPWDYKLKPLRSQATGKHRKSIDPAMPDFTPALSTPGSWSVGDSQYGEGKYMQLKIPVSAVHELCTHLMAMADDAASHKSINVWNYQTSSAQDVPGIVLSCKGKEGQYGAFGQINPAKHGTATRPAAAATDMPF